MLNYELGVLEGKPHDECGVFGIFNVNNYDAASLTYYGLYALQHRGQESAGIAVSSDNEIFYHKDMGLVNEVFKPDILKELKGDIAIGHVRYSTTGSSLRENAQPMVARYVRGKLAIAHNGNLVNAAELRLELESKGALFQTSIDSEVIANLLARECIKDKPTESSLEEISARLKGSYAVIVMTGNKLIGMRDPNGFRPLSLGKLGDSYIMASETCALDAVGAEFIKDFEPGEIIVVDKSGMTSIKTKPAEKTSMCIFEYIYFARPDSIMNGINVYDARKAAGRMLAKENPVEADLVIGVPDSGLSAALGYSEESGIPFDQGLIKNRYTGRTFIQPEQAQREIGVRIKLNALKTIIEGKRLVLVEDSIVRGTTIRWIIQLLRQAGAKEIHMRVASPPYKHPCHFGIDISSSSCLIAATKEVQDICDSIGADSLCYLSKEGLVQTVKKAGCDFCTACFDNCYPIEVPEEGDKNIFENRK
ncbi:MAG: amidophosphoribosyltransferase [Ignavibacteriales bacterium]